LKKDKTLRILFVSGTAIIALFFIIIIIKIYDYTLNDAKRSHQIQQMEMARAAISGISIYLNRLTGDMHLLSDFPGVRKFDMNVIKTNTDLLYGHYDDKIIKSIFIMDNRKHPVYFAGSTIPSSFYDDPGFDTVSFSKDTPYFSHIKSLYGNDIKSGLFFELLMPFTTNSSSPAGYIGYIVSFDSLVNKYIVPLKLGEKDFAWIMDGSGRLIYHPNHKNMLLRGITQASSSCSNCHKSFDVQKKMISGSGSYDEYVISNEPPKIMAYVPIKLNGDKWIFAISTFLPEVTASLRDKFNLFFGLGIIILIVIFSLGFLLYYQTVRKIRAEEANLHMEQRQSFQEQLNHAAKLASIGELVDSVAHEINTPLGIISSYIDVFNLRNDFPQKYAEDFSVIKNQTKRINNYTRSLLNYSQRIPFNPKPEDISVIIEECLFLLSPQFHSKRIRIVRSYKHDHQLIEIDKGQIEQVFINLFNNAVDAISNNGEIRIDITTEERNISTINQEEISFIVVSVTDNGSGIKPENINNIFEAFYTTKSGGKGTGLGLSISKAIMLRHKGRIEASSQPGKFTTFKLFFPVNKKGSAL